MKVTLRYNFRNPPEWFRPSAGLYARILDQISWADAAGFDQIAVSEHHFLEEGFLPSLLPVCAAIAARTSRVRIGTEVFLLPLHHPVRVAEDAAMVDILSNGRFEMIVGAGYRNEEYAGFGMTLPERGGRMDECLEIIKRCWREDEVSFTGRYYQISGVRLMPRPVQPGGPPILIGAGSPAAARRAARLADGIYPMDGALWDVYYEECERLGRPVERKRHAPPGGILLHITQDPERDWDIIRPHATFEIDQYRHWNLEGATSFGDLDQKEAALRMAYRVMTPDDAVAMLVARQAEYPEETLNFAPLVAGMDPEMAQASLELFAGKVRPAVEAAARAA
jgi:alkanesulfonate monooxygenase SsuD/methylene tetrahydromethanopterin reductase-like flavin-dependent oxidoreductase (luciferase family)